tara:strand:- start:203 stop:415 length:213 start_codon:yes stop_codon:yes gene_type:complete
MKLTINGELTFFKESKEPLTIARVVKQLTQHPQLIVIEFNGEILDQKTWAHQEVKDGDKLEIVTIVGGGS